MTFSHSIHTKMCDHSLRSDIGLSLAAYTFVIFIHKNTNKMSISKFSSFNILGITVRTSNHDGAAAQDIPALWGKFMGENTIAKIPNIIDQNIHCIYTEYEGDYTQPYTVLLGMKVASLEDIPDGLTGMTFTGGTYQSYHAEGKMADNVVYDTWNQIWKDPLNRAYTSDIEIYNAEKSDSESVSVDIHIAIK